MVALSAALVSWPAAGSGDCELIRTEVQGASFDSIGEAVYFAATTWLEDSRRFDREWVGGILQHPDGRYLLSAGAGCSGQDTVTFSVPITPGIELAAFWHTHGGDGYARNWFSEDDARLVVDAGLDFYLITPGGEIKVLQPEDLGPRARPASGRSVDLPLAVPPVSV